MNSLLFERSSGRLGPNEFARIQTATLLRSLAPAPRFRFDGGERATNDTAANPESEGTAPAPGGTVFRSSDGNAVRRVSSLWAHQAGVNALALERFDGRIMVSGGSDATIKIWDLEQCPNPSRPHTYRPLAVVARAHGDSPIGGHRFGITHLSFYPFDSAAFLSCSHDQTLKLWSTERASISGSFNLGARVYTHAISPIASHLLVACGTQHPAVRLVDLRSSAAVQSLVSPGQIGGSAGATLSTSWSPVHEHILATGSADGAVRIWDVRKSNGLVALLDQEDVIGIADVGPLSSSQERALQLAAKAHAGPVNGLTWTEDGAYLVSAGHDRRIRVWDAATGANTLANFGPSIRNGQMGTVTMFVSPLGLTAPGTELLFFPNETEILVMDLHEGSTITRLRGMGPVVASVGTQRGGERTIKNRITSLVWRGAGGSGGSSGIVMGGSNTAGGIFSGHLDGQIRAWLPQLEGVDDEGDDYGSTDFSEVKSRKRKILDDTFRSLMGRQVTFS
ncbi:WD40-repeat-containing domain protein [Corynascus novoguineensis]|uniref:WD40-repeat-containing domain protein n=1 Tax=Corynascus novoguineensis TaxID=1126955 RepID=A0AAN7CPN4_9PEZI|nr:WD40-repeat-containing domain protein [Corynascus novoguineensis]